MFTKALLFSLLPLASAHFKLLYPAARGFDEDILGTFPCGGQDTVTPNRTMWPMSNAPIQLQMGHATTNVEVLLAFGNDATDAFNTVLVPTFHLNGIGLACLANITVPSGLNITDGMNATIQVQTNADSGVSGLYNCADITFTSTPLSAADLNSDCQQDSAITGSALVGDTAINANETEGTETSIPPNGAAPTPAPNGTASSTSSAASTTGSGASSASAGAGSSSSSMALAAPTNIGEMAAWAVGAFGLVGGLAAL